MIDHLVNYELLRRFFVILYPLFLFVAIVCIIIVIF